ncbi:hypothetical protein [Paenarthrobacter sp. Z7-10]|uniref:hypothetical protein n=1 Tax=Paenarthrobacter sp. Z7-10 TaxID=2787635 RepID=UPI003FA6D49A
MVSPYFFSAKRSRAAVQPGSGEREEHSTTTASAEGLGARAPRTAVSPPSARRPGGHAGDEPGLTLVRSQVSALRHAMAAPAAGSAAGDVAAFAETGIFTGRYPGNITLVGTTFAWPASWTTELLARGPHPATVLTGPELDRLAG